MYVYLEEGAEEHLKGWRRARHPPSLSSAQTGGRAETERGYDTDQAVSYSAAIMLFEEQLLLSATHKLSKSCGIFVDKYELPLYTSCNPFPYFATNKTLALFHGIQCGEFQYDSNRGFESEKKNNNSKHWLSKKVV